VCRVMRADLGRHLIDQDDRKVVLASKRDELLTATIEQADPQTHVGKVLAKVESHAVHDDKTDLQSAIGLAQR